MPNVTFHCPVCGNDIDYNLANLPDPTQAVIDFASSILQEIIPPPGAGKRLRITSIVWSVQGGVNMEIYMLSGATNIGIFSGNAYSDEWSPALVLAENEGLNMLASATYQVYGQVCYYSEDVV